MNIKEMIDSNFRGNIYIVKDNEVLCENVTGFADLANEVPNSLETKFASASAGKVFVAVGILQLIEQGEIRFDDTIGKILDIDLQNIDDEVTVEIKTKTGVFYVSGSLESFAEELEDTISDMNTIDNYDFDSNF